MFSASLEYVAVRLLTAKYGCGKRLPTQGIFTFSCGSSGGHLCDRCRRRPINMDWVKWRLRIFRKGVLQKLDYRFGPYEMVELESENPLITPYKLMPRWPDRLITAKFRIENYLMFRKSPSSFRRFILGSTKRRLRD